MKRKIHAVWTGDGANGSGLLSSQSGAFENMPYSFKTRFANEDGKLGTNLEELIAASLEGCYDMRLSLVRNESNCCTEKISTDVTL